LFLQEMAKITTVTSFGQSQADYEQTKLGEWIFVLMVYIQVYDIAINMKTNKEQLKILVTLFF
jgi:hypothetical protein